MYGDQRLSGRCVAPSEKNKARASTDGTGEREDKLVPAWFPGGERGRQAGAHCCCREGVSQRRQMGIYHT